MDPLVRAALIVQQAIARAIGTLLSVGFALYLVYAVLAQPPWQLSAAVGVALSVSVFVRAVRRLKCLVSEETARLDLELFTHLTVVVFAAVLCAPGGLDGPYYALTYALMMVGAAFARPAAAIGTVLFAVLLEGALGHFVFGSGLVELAPHAILLGVFAALNLLVFRAEIARVRRLSRSRLESEIERMREDARSYRLIGAPTNAVEPASSPNAAPKGDPERLIRSSVDQIQATLRYTLDLLRRALGLRTAALLWLSDDRERLVVRELSTDVGDVDRGPFSAAVGLFGAALGSRRPVSLAGARAHSQVPYYTSPQAVGAVSVVPVIEHGQTRGLLAVDREAVEPFAEAEIDLAVRVIDFVLRTIENERVFVQLERAKVEQGKLYRAVDLLAAATTEAQVIEAGVSSAREFASFHFAVVTLFHRQGNVGVHEICAASGDGAKTLVGQTFRHNSGLVSMVVANRHPLPYRGDYDSERQVVFTRHIEAPPMPSLVVLPLIVHDNVLGTLVLGSNERGAFGDAVRPLLEVLSRHIAVSLANARMVKRLEDLATSDGLTGHFNKRAVTELARQKIRSAERFSKPLSLLICDIDHFKRVNDNHGHDVGDLVIRGFADVLRRSKRDTDAVGRFGGEEFIVVCEETDSAGAEQLAERIRSDFASTTFHTQQGPLSITCSVGVATFPRAGSDWETLFKSTDEALYASKRGGRNRVTVWTPKHRGLAA